jgi:hypothetical protein
MGRFLSLSLSYVYIISFFFKEFVPCGGIDAHMCGSNTVCFDLYKSDTFGTLQSKFEFK